MIGSALVGTCVVSVALLPALVTPFLANEKRHRLCVFGDVGGDVVVADARVREVVRRAVVLDGVLGGDTGLLETDEGALGLSHLAPVTPRALGNAVRVDAVLLLGCREASRGKKGQDDGGTHIDMSDKSWEKADGLWMD